MSSLESLRKSHDPVISAVLNQIFERFQIDPETVRPDYRLGNDLGLSRVDVQMVFFHSAKSLGIDVPFESCRIDDSSLRQMVETLKRWNASASHNAA